MALSDLDNVTAQIQTFWAKLFMDELRQDNILFNLVNRDYEGEIREGGGNTVRVSQLNAPTGQRLTIDGAGSGRTFTPETISTSYVDVVADQRLVASYDFHDLVAVQSLIDPLGAKSMEVRAAFMQAISNQLNAYLYSLVAPGSGNITYSTASMTAAILQAQRERASTLKWNKMKGWYGLLNPAYYGDLLLETTLTSSDFGAQDAPVIGGNIGLKRYGFNLFEDNTGAQAAQTPDTNGLFFHPDFLLLVTQYEPRLMVSSKHSQGEFAYVVSLDWVVGAKLGIDGANKHLVVTPNAAP